MPTSGIKQPHALQGTHQTAGLHKPFPGMLEGMCEPQQLELHNICRSRSVSSIKKKNNNRSKEKARVGATCAFNPHSFLMSDPQDKFTPPYLGC